MQASRSSSELRFRVRRALRAFVALGVLGVLSVGAVGCVTVRPEDKEYLADPSMTYGGEARVQAQEQHVFDNREGSLSAVGASGGGCGCN